MKKRFTRQESYLLGLLLVLGAAACIVLLFSPPGSPWLPKCLFHRWTGLHCPGCGVTRAVYSLLHGDLKSSLHNNLLLIPGGLLVVLLIVKKDIALRRPVAIAIVAIILAFTVLRNIPCAPFTLLAPIPLPLKQEQISEEPDAADRQESDRQKDGGEKEKPEPAERQGAFRGGGEIGIRFQAGFSRDAGPFPGGRDAPFFPGGQRRF